MRINLRSLLLLLTVFVMQAVAFAGSIDTPTLQPGRYVYTVPGNFDPPLVGRSGIQQIQSEAAKLHYPFYVVLAQDFDGSSDEDLSDALDELAADWGKNPNFKRAESSIFVLTYSPRKYRLLAASSWRAKYDLEGSGSDQFSSIFAQYAKGSSKDPVTGIIECMKALDNYVFERNDPAHIAVRAENERRALAVRRHQEAAASLDRQILQMENLLSSRDVLPSDTSPYRNALNRAIETRKTNNAAQMAIAAGTLGVANQKLSGLVGQARAAIQRDMDRLATAERAKQAALRAEQAKQVFNQVLLGLCGLFLLGLCLLRYRKYKALSAQLKTAIDLWEQPLRYAAENHVRFFEERMAVTELESTTGRTKEKYDEITREIGTVYPKIEAMQERVDRCKEIFARGSFFSLRPLKDALVLLDADFEFDTETLNRKSLFEPPSRMLQVKPAELRSQIENLYSENITDWDELMKALELRGTIAQDAFPQTGLDEILQEADAKNIPHDYFASHPLFGDGESDSHFYDDLNSFRLSDPLLYKERLEEREQQQSELRTLLSRLTAAIDLVASRRVKVLPVYGDTVIAPEDDPVLTLAQANRADEQLAGFIAARKEIEVVEKVAETTGELYSKAVEQAGSIGAAIANINADIAALASHQEVAQALNNQANTRLQQTLAIHSNTASVSTSLSTGRDYLGCAQHFAEKTKRLLAENRHLDARKTVQEAERQLSLAENEFNQCLRGCDELDALKAQYERQAALVDAAREQAEASMRRYGSNARLRQFESQRFMGPVDYALQIAQINAYRQEIENTARQVRRAYEAEQARIAREAERERQAEAARERARSASHSSSSFGSSWGSSSSSSSGGSWSSGSSSRSSSSGGDW